MAVSPAELQRIDAFVPPNIPPSAWCSGRTVVAGDTNGPHVVPCDLRAGHDGKCQPPEHGPGPQHLCGPGCRAPMDALPRVKDER